jgi:hypothetical protein
MGTAAILGVLGSVGLGFHAINTGAEVTSTLKFKGSGHELQPSPRVDPPSSAPGKE